MHTLFTPTWFYGYDFVMHSLFAVISLMLAIFSLRLSKLTEQRQARLFGIGFLLISASYFAKIIFNVIILLNLGTSSIPAVLGLEYWSVFIHGSLALCGLLVLLYMTFGIKNANVFVAMLTLTLFALTFNDEPFLLFYMISAMCFAFISLFYIRNYMERKSSRALVSALAFILLLVATLHSIMPGDNPAMYVSGHIFELIAYVLILGNLYMVFRK